MSLLLLMLTSMGPALAPADHCALFDAIHREQFSSRNETDHGFALQTFAGPGQPELTCPTWKRWDAAPTEVVVFDPPAFSRRGVSASVEFSVLHFKHHWDTRRVTGRSAHRCEFDRVGTAWRLKSCRLTAQSG